MKYMGQFTKTTAVLLFLLIWLAVFNGAIIVKRRLTSPAARFVPAARPFAFAEPSEDELRAMENERKDSGFGRLRLTKPIGVFACPKKTCKRLGTLLAGEELKFQLETMQDSGDWLPVLWNGNGEATGTIGYVSGADLEMGFQMPPPLPQTSFIPDESDALLPPVEAVPIDPQTIVGIVCQFDSDDDRRITRGSGAIVTNDGYVITARSVVDLTYLQGGMENYKLMNCLLGQLPASTPLPSTEQIRKVNAFVRVPYLSYTADVAYLPQEDDLSDYEKAWLDFAVIKISGINPDVKFFGGPTEVPDNFPVAPFLISELPKIGDDTLNFAFPSGTTVGFAADIRTLFMQGLISHVTGFWEGDGYYADDLFLVESYLDTEDTAGGRFGSPIFWKGYVVGIHTAKQQGSRQIYNLGAKAVLGNMASNQFVIPLSVQ